MKEPEKKPGEPFSVRVGDFVENSIEQGAFCRIQSTKFQI